MCAWQWDWGTYMLTCISYILSTSAMLWVIPSSLTATQSQHQPTLPQNGNTLSWHCCLPSWLHTLFSAFVVPHLVFSLNLKCLSACINVVLYTFSYSPGAEITCFCQNFTPDCCISCFSPNDSMFMSSFTFIYVSLCWHFGSWAWEVKKLHVWIVCSTSAACWRAKAYSWLANTKEMVQQKQREAHSVTSLMLRRCPSGDAGPRLPETEKWFLFSHLFQESPAHWLSTEFLMKNSRPECSGLFLERTRAPRWFPGKEIKRGPPRC